MGLLGNRTCGTGSEDQRTEKKDELRTRDESPDSGVSLCFAAPRLANVCEKTRFNERTVSDQVPFLEVSGIHFNNADDVRFSMFD